MYNINDNVVALATSPGLSAINVIRCSGPDVLKIIKRILVKKKPLKPNYCFLSFIMDPETKEMVDQCMVVPFLKPKSYTGQDMVEISIHGGRAVSEKMIGLLNKQGCRIAEKGEFTYRAFINGKIDLIQAEAISNIVNGDSSIDVSYALENLGGSLSNTIKKACNNLKNIITYMEHELDFNENEIDHKTIEQYSTSINRLIKDVKHVSTHSFINNQNSSDLKIVIAGKTNAGKSSLFNYLAGYQRSIVTSLSGTTRDTVEIDLTINNIKVSLIDTAGLRKTKDSIEKEGIERTHKTISTADFVVFVDAEDPKSVFKNLNLRIPIKKIIFVQNKIDVFPTQKDKNIFLISCKKKIGGDKLLTYLSTLVDVHREQFMRDYSYVVSDRLMEALILFVEKLETTKELLKNGQEFAIIVSSLYDAYDLFISASSPSNKQEIINTIFSGFCVGK